MAFTSLLALWLTAIVGAHATIPLQMKQELDLVEQDVSTYPYHRDFKTCPLSLDIAYFVDGSDSISDDEYDMQKTIVKVMAYFFGVMKRGTHDAVINYGETAEVAISFLDHEKFEPFRDAVRAITKIGGNTRLDRALEVAHDSLFMGGGGARESPDITKIAVIFTDGVTGGVDLNQAVTPLANKGVKVFVVGIGPSVNADELANLTPRPDLVYTAHDILDAYVKAGFIARQICQHAQYMGEMGPPGPPGPIGPPGPSGPVGDPGADGERGSQGSEGPQGSRGPSGPDGESGSPGQNGADGDPGPQGPKGPKGSAGGSGETGPQGAPGDPGNPGDDGPRGPKGVDGLPGDAGDPGSDGSDGNSGSNGQPGAPGPQGDDGDPGPPGASGTDGQNGSPGPKGQPGSPGSQGPPGQKGAVGPKGDRGQRGSDGAPGSPGSPGLDGQDGSPGTPGEDGNDGPPGPDGPAGNNGPQGSPGPNGEDGIVGNPGPRGPKGPDGSDGSDASQTIVCDYNQSGPGQQSVSCDDNSYTATDCGCSRGCGGWRISDDGQTCTCDCNTYVPQGLRSTGINCCRLE